MKPRQAHSGNTAPEPTRAQVFRRVRDLLGCTQAQMAELLGVSAKAVESYEQGWRHVPDRTLRHQLTILSLAREKEDIVPVCWRSLKCPREVRDVCLGYRLTGGRFCWQMASPVCRRRRTNEDSIDTCLACPVVQHLIAGDADVTIM